MAKPKLKPGPVFIILKGRQITWVKNQLYFIFWKMAGLLDYIFTNLDAQPLTRQEILEHLAYLNEIITPDMPVADQVK